jgi:hypothetical protein
MPLTGLLGVLVLLRRSLWTSDIDALERLRPANRQLRHVAFWRKRDKDSRCRLSACPVHRGSAYCGDESAAYAASGTAEDQRRTGLARNATTSASCSFDSFLPKPRGMVFLGYPGEMYAFGSTIDRRRNAASDMFAR